MQVSIQYMWQHVLWSGAKGFAVKDELKSIAMVEMKHAEMIAERLNYLGGIPTTKPEPIFIGENLREMLETDKKNEETAINLRKILEMPTKREMPLPRYYSRRSSPMRRTTTTLFRPYSKGCSQRL